MSGLCRPCKKHLTWCLEILMLRWDYIKYIDIYSVLEVVKNNRRLFNDSLKFSFDKNQILQLILQKIIVFLFKEFSFYLFEMSLPEISKQSEWCFVEFFNCACYNFWSNTFYF